jgi:hypothetical protein
MPQFAYATVVSTPSDAAHAIALAHSLRRRGSRVPLVVLHPARLDGEARCALDGEAAALSLTTAVADGLSGGGGGGALEDRRDGPGSDGDEAEAGPAGAQEEEAALPLLPPQLAVFGPALWEHETVCAVAPRSVVVRRGMDLVFAAPLPTGDWLGAVPLCGCAPAATPPSSLDGVGGSTGAGAGKARAPPAAVECPHAQQDAGSSVGGSPVLVDAAPLSPASPLSPRGLMTPSRALSFSALASRLPPPPPSAAGARIDPRLLLFCPDERLRDRVLAAVEADRTGSASSDRSSSSSSSSTAPRPAAQQQQRPPPDRRGAADDDLDRASRILHAAFPARWAPLPATYLASRALRANHPALDGGGGHRDGGGLRIVCVHCEETGRLDVPPSRGRSEAVAEEGAEDVDELAAALAAWRAERLAAGGEGAREAVERVDRLLASAPGRRRSVAAVGEALPESPTGSWRIPPELEARAVGALAF